MDSDNIFSKPKIPTESQNIFAAASPVAKPFTPASIHRLNDFDSNILEEKAYLDIKDHMLKLEYRIGVLEDELSSVEDDISQARVVGNIQDLDMFTIRKRALETEIASLSKRYEELNISTRLSGEIASALKRRPKKRFNIFKVVGNYVKKGLTRISKRFSSGQSLKFSLQKLSSINKNVDELINLQTPYGETLSRYERLTNYLSSANRIHYQITKNLGSLK